MVGWADLDRPGVRRSLAALRTADLAPVIDHVLACFGTPRTMAGSDWPVCLLAAGYATVQATLDPALAQLDTAEPPCSAAPPHTGTGRARDEDPPAARLGRHELGFGGSSLGNLYAQTSDDEARKAVDAAWDGGVRYFDTAPHYGLGLSERRLGTALAGRPRDAYILSTKVGRLLEPNPAPTESDLPAGGFAVPDDLVRRFDFSRDGVLRSLEESLDRLGVSRIDIVYVHDPDEHMD